MMIRSFNTAIQDLVATFPELEPHYQELLKDDDAPGQYIVYEGIFGPFIQALLLRDPSPKRDALLQKSFKFIESMLCCPDLEVSNLAYVGLLEWQGPWWYSRAQPFLGELARATLNKYDPVWCNLDGWHPPPSGDELSDAYELGRLVDRLLE